MRVTLYTPGGSITADDDPSGADDGRPIMLVIRDEDAAAKDEPCCH